MLTIRFVTGQYGDTVWTDNYTLHWVGDACYSTRAIARPARSTPDGDLVGGQGARNHRQQEPLRRLDRRLAGRGKSGYLLSLGCLVGRGSCSTDAFNRVVDVNVATPECKAGQRGSLSEESRSTSQVRTQA